MSDGRLTLYCDKCDWYVSLNDYPDFGDEHRSRTVLREHEQEHHASGEPVVTSLSGRR